jgi:hypothetical protein
MKHGYLVAVATKALFILSFAESNAAETKHRVTFVPMSSDTAEMRSLKLYYDGKSTTVLPSGSSLELPSGQQRVNATAVILGGPGYYNIERQIQQTLVIEVNGATNIGVVAQFAGNRASQRFYLELSDGQVP